jgi:hypothetical protein
MFYCLKSKIGNQRKIILLLILFAVSVVVPMKFHLYPHDTNEIMKTAWVSMEEMTAMSLNADVNQYIRNEKRNRIHNIVA